MLDDFYGVNISFNQKVKNIYINTSKELLQKDGSAILGRFFIALLSQAVIKRSTIPEQDRIPYMVYILVVF